MMKLPERRRFVRIEVPLQVLVKVGDFAEEVVTKNVSPVGLRFEISRSLKESGEVALALCLPTTDEPIRLTGRVVWQNKTSLEDNAPYDVGIEVVDIEDGDKNIYLKYLCDLLYDSTYKART